MLVRFNFLSGFPLQHHLQPGNALKIGEAGVLEVFSEDTSDLDPRFVVEIECFIQPPQPPTLQPCTECGQFRVKSGDQVGFAASPVFQYSGGFLRFKIRDLKTSDVRLYEIPVSSSE